jgi:uncharacterized protein
MPERALLFSSILVFASLALAAGLTLTLSASAEGQSFDCRAALSAAEETICANDELRDFDSKLGQTYLGVINGVAHESDVRLRQRQTQWLKEREDCRDSVECLKNLYKTRLRELRELATQEVPSSVVGRWAGDEAACSGEPAAGATAFQISPRAVKASGAAVFDCQIKKVRSTSEGVFLNVNCAKGPGYFDIRRSGEDYLHLFAQSPDGSGEDEFDLERCPHEGEASAADTEKLTYWKYDHSTVVLQAEGTSRKFLYDSPGPAARKAGVRRGALLFFGIFADGNYDGTSYLITRRCGAVSYPVSGRADEGARRLVLRGRAPRLDSRCQARGSRPRSIVFTLISGETP